MKDHEERRMSIKNHAKAKLMERRSKARAKSVLDTMCFLETPEDVANEMAALIADAGWYSRILEPSAGEGSLLAAIGRLEFPPNSVTVDYCESDSELLHNLQRNYPQYNHVGYDFLAYKPINTYNFILMNPPAEANHHVFHIEHAWTMLAKKGLLVVLLSKNDSQALYMYQDCIISTKKLKSAAAEHNVTGYMHVLKKPE